MDADEISSAFICLGRVRRLGLFSIETNHLIADALNPTLSFSLQIPRGMIRIFGNIPTITRLFERQSCLDSPTVAIILFIGNKLSFPLIPVTAPLNKHHDMTIIAQLFIIDGITRTQ